MALLLTRPGGGPLALTLTGLVLAGCGDDDPRRAPDAGDAAVDASGDARAAPSCDSLGPLPAWATADAPDELVARCDGLSLALTAHADGLLHARWVRAGTDPPARSWAIAEVPARAEGARSGGAGDGSAVLCAPELVAAVEPGTCRLHVTDAAGNTLVDERDGGGAVWAGGTVTLTRDAPAGERFYGYGEKTGPLDRRGRALTFWNTDAYDPAHGGFPPDADPLYASIPFGVALHDGVAHGVFTDVPRRLVIDLAKTDLSRTTVRASTDALDQWIVAGPAIAEVLRRTAGLTGAAPLPPAWALGYHQSRWGYAPDTRLEEVAQAFRDRRIPADAVWLDIQHMEGLRTFTWDPVAFPDPAGLAARLADQGFALVVIADPGIAADDGWDVYREGVDGGHFLETAAGEVFHGTAWPGQAAFPDFTRAATRAWWAGHVGALVDLGVRGVWLDVNEPTTFPEGGGGNTVPDELPVDGDGVPTTMAEAHNVYGLEEARATREGMRAAAPGRRPFLLTRAGYAGVQRVGAMWTGDAPSTWQSLQQTMPMLLGLGLSGMPFVGSDVGGYSGHATPELFARWMALGSVSPFFRGHVTSGVPDQEPWAFGPGVEDASRGFIGARYRLLPYLYSLFAEARTSGAPILRAMILEFQDDPAFETLGDQAMLGPFVLVAPVVEEGAERRSVVLPAGRWTELASGAVWQGPGAIDVSAALPGLPAFARAGAILPRGPLRQWTGEAVDGPLELDLYPAEGAAPSAFALYEDAGDGDGASALTTLQLESTAEGAQFVVRPRVGDWVPPARALLVRLHGAAVEPSGVERDGVALPRQDDPGALDARSPAWAWDAEDRAIVVVVPDTDGLELVFRYDPRMDDPRPLVRVPVEVRVPAGTAEDAPVTIATSASGWVHAPLTWTGRPGVAAGTVLVPRGEWFAYKYARGDWDTVEKLTDCSEAPDRDGFGAAHPGLHDTVATWRDECQAL